MTNPFEHGIDLDSLAPLGGVRGNAADWFKEFSRHGARYDEWFGRRTEFEINGETWRLLPDPLLREAEPWVEQATCRFHTDQPNLLMMIDLARSWVARGRLAADNASALDDFRRAIKLGRLLRQDGLALIQDLVAIACIRLGAEALYEHARSGGDAATMVVTSLVLADRDALRDSTTKAVALLEPGTNPGDGTGFAGDGTGGVSELLQGLEDRRFRMEGLIGLHSVAQLGTGTQRRAARAALKKLTRDPDERFAETARSFCDLPAAGESVTDSDS